MVQHLLGRKGAARIALIPPEVLEALNEGLLPTANFNEFLALDLPRLTRGVARDIGVPPEHERIEDTLAMLGAFRPVKRHQHVARALYDLAEPRSDRDAVAHALATHPSDVARSWAAQWIAFSGLSLTAKLESARRFAADPHFGVRETAWMAVRDEVIGAVDEAVQLLAPWVRHPDENIRRFASELTRPRGVWCAPIEVLKLQLWRALPLLEPLKADRARYVQNSVGNWLNDAGKTQPDWVREVCMRWSTESPTPATAHIVRRAQRSIDDRG
jgi:3-methyladenine DNA glycosylase AlkC